MCESIEQFLKAVKESGLVSYEELDSHSGELRTGTTPEQAAAALVEKELLTPFQADRILSGQVQDCIIADRFVLLERIGSGGMGSVFRAKDSKLGRMVAIKIMAPHNLQDPDAIMRFKREARALAQFALPNVVQAFDSGEDRGRNFLVMEYVEGISLSDLVRERGKIPPTVAADYVYQTAIGMDHAHGRGLIHRDIKPANLLLTPEGQIKILDLGLARFVQDQIPDSDLTRDNVGMGTPDYMAPEQFRDARSVDPRADVYSLGCTLYYLVAGLVPFPGSSLSEKADAHENKAPPPLDERCPEIPAGLALTIEKMMAKRPADRFQHMKGVAEALAPYVASSSPSLPSIRKTVSWSGDQLVGGRRRRPLLAWGAVGAALVSVLALMLWWPELGKLAGKSEADGQRDGGSYADENADGGAQLKTGDATQGRGDEPGESSDALANPPIAPPDDPNVLTVSQHAEQGGEYRTINAALKDVNPGQTIRILDDKVYLEPVRINSPNRHQGITLEGIHNAVIAAEPLAGNLVEVNGVGRVQLRGLQIRATDLAAGQPAALLAVIGPCTGFHAVDLRFESPVGSPVNGIEFLSTPTGAERPPAIIERCEFVGGMGGVGVVAAAVDYKTAYTVGDLIVRENLFQDVAMGVVVQGSGRRIQIVGNRILNASRCGLQLENLVEGVSHLLMANNTVFESDIAFRVWDERPRGENVQVRNNVFLDSKSADTLFIDSGGSPTTPRGPGDGAAVHDVWQMSYNTRDQQAPALLGPFAKAWIPPSKDDLPPANSGDFHLDRNDRENLLRPKDNLSLADLGAGDGDPPLPAYIGALPPTGVEPFDWGKTWNAWKGVDLAAAAAGDATKGDAINGDHDTAADSGR